MSQFGIKIEISEPFLQALMKGKRRMSGDRARRIEEQTHGRVPANTWEISRVYTKRNR